MTIKETERTNLWHAEELNKTEKIQQHNKIPTKSNKGNGRTTRKKFKIQNKKEKKFRQRIKQYSHQKRGTEMTIKDDIRNQKKTTQNAKKNSIPDAG
jgi:DNA primase catalytic subunit